MNSLFCYLFCLNSIIQNNILLTILIGICCSFLAVLIYNLLQSYSLRRKMKKINGTYFEFDENDIQKKYSECTIIVKMNWKILLGSWPYLQINQINEKRGLWKSRLPLSISNPLIAVGNYNYLKSKTWGIQTITINLKDEIIYVRSEDMVKKEEERKISKYWLKKKL